MCSRSFWRSFVAHKLNVATVSSRQDTQEIARVAEILDGGGRGGCARKRKLWEWVFQELLQLEGTV